MIGSSSFKYAARSLFRNTRRTILSVAGIGIGCAIGLFANSYYAGAAEMQIRAASESGAGHLRVVPERWPETRENSLRLSDWRQALDAVKATPQVELAAPRARANGLLAFGNRTLGIEVVGVDPEVEKKANRIVKKAALEGRYLLPGDRDKTVIGREAAKRLGVELEDLLLVTVSGKGEIKSAMLEIVGILETGSRELDASICQVTLDNIARITGYQNAGEIAIMLESHKLIDRTKAVLEEKIPAGNTVVTWKAVNPGLAANVEGDTAFFRILSFLIVVVVMLGITSAQLTSVLERRREFGILTALGMKGRQIASVLFLEAVATGTAGGLLALLLGGYASYLLATKGLDMRAMMGNELAISGVLMDPYVYADFGPWIIAYAFGVSLAATSIACIYPAWFATKTDPASALRVE